MDLFRRKNGSRTKRSWRRKRWKRERRRKCKSDRRRGKSIPVSVRGESIVGLSVLDLVDHFRLRRGDGKIGSRLGWVLAIREKEPNA